MMKKIRSLISFIIIFLSFFYFYTSQNPHNQTGAAGHMSYGYVEIPKENEIPAVNYMGETIVLSSVMRQS